MVTCGIDVGSLTGKAVLLNERDILAQKIIRVKKTPVETALRTRSGGSTGVSLTISRLLALKLSSKSLMTDWIPRGTLRASA